METCQVSPTGGGEQSRELSEEMMKFFESTGNESRRIIGGEKKTRECHLSLAIQLQSHCLIRGDTVYTPKDPICFFPREWNVPWISRACGCECAQTGKTFDRWD